MLGKIKVKIYELSYWGTTLSAIIVFALLVYIAPVQPTVNITTPIIINTTDFKLKDVTLNLPLREANLTDQSSSIGLSPISEFLWFDLGPNITDHDSLKSLDYVRSIEVAVKKYSKIYQLDEELIYAVIHQESCFYQFEHSGADCYGLMQICYPVWKKEYVIFDWKDLFEVDNNIRLGCFILRRYINQNHGNVRKALCGYFGICDTSDEYAEKIFRKMEMYKNLNHPGGKPNDN